jgi:DNA-binding LacI/PurR family transcriptional regulator
MIAKEAGVSPGLVSAFFSGKHYGPDRKRGIGISEATKEKIRRTCHRLNYIPDNPLGFYRLYPEKADVALLLNEKVGGGGFSNPYHSLIVEGFARVALESQVDLSNLLYRDEHDYLVDPTGLPNSIQRGSIKKVALIGRPLNYSLVYRLFKMDAAIVLAGQSIPMDGLVSVVPDFFAAGKLGIQVLAEHGHREILVGWTHTTDPRTYNGKLLHEGCRVGAEEHGIVLRDDDFIKMGHSPNYVDALLPALSRPKPPTAIFCLEDQLARSVSVSLQNFPSELNSDLAVLGCNDDRINQEQFPRRSTIALPCREVGALAFQEVNRIAVEGRPEGDVTRILPVKYVDNGTLRPRRAS